MGFLGWPGPVDPPGSSLVLWGHLVSFSGSSIYPVWVFPALGIVWWIREVRRLLLRSFDSRSTCWPYSCLWTQISKLFMTQIFLFLCAAWFPWSLTRAFYAQLGLCAVWVTAFIAVSMEPSRWVARLALGPFHFVEFFSSALVHWSLSDASVKKAEKILSSSFSKWRNQGPERLNVI